mmetsp:Transcript_6406/g.14733  ORF Transcript_6406/g.14733 Transcript_6406/m.14733 type:complete len:337 (+) Transcript_6406:66-1076(+)
MVELLGPDAREGDRAEALAQLLNGLADGYLPTEVEALQLLSEAAVHFKQLATLVEIQVPPGGALHVVGDLHGQYCELMTILSLCGMPQSGRNMFLFNGDFVDRGTRSVETMLALAAMAVAAPGSVFLNRGNHEFAYMSRAYGFEDEALLKYPRNVFDAFQDVFSQLPLASLINKSVFVTHGGLFRSPGVSLEDVAAIRRGGPCGELAQDLLWSDPVNEDGRYQSQRGAGICFGPDVTEEFCRENNLLCCIRSHEVKHRGYEWQRGGRCLTVFSAANYVGRMGNLGAVCHIRPHGERVENDDLSISTFEGAQEDAAFRDRQARVQVTFPSAPLRSRL